MDSKDSWIRLMTGQFFLILLSQFKWHLFSEAFWKHCLIETFPVAIAFIVSPHLSLSDYFSKICAYHIQLFHHLLHEPLTRLLFPRGRDFLSCSLYDLRDSDSV